MTDHIFKLSLKNSVEWYITLLYYIPVEWSGVESSLHQYMHLAVFCKESTGVQWSPYGLWGGQQSTAMHHKCHNLKFIWKFHNFERPMVDWVLPQFKHHHRHAHWYGDHELRKEYGCCYDVHRPKILFLKNLRGLAPLPVVGLVLDSRYHIPGKSMGRVLVGMGPGLDLVTHPKPIYTGRVSLILKWPVVIQLTPQMPNAIMSYTVVY